MAVLLIASMVERAPSPRGEAALLLLGEAVAEEAGIRRPELDQLLW